MSLAPWLGLLCGSLLVAACQPPAPALCVSMVGDVLLDRAVPAALARDSAALLQTTRALWAGSRYVIGNLECPLTIENQPARKPFVFRGSPYYAWFLRDLGFTHVSLANNHTLDQHAGGLYFTNRAVQTAGLHPLGYQADSLAGCRPTLLGPDSSVAVFAYSAFYQRVAGEGCLCGRDFAALCERVAAYKTLFPERAVLVYLHWGTEYADLPSAVQRAQARTLIDCGAAAVVGSHPHVVQPVEFYRGCPILYSLGNFLFDQQGRQTDLALQVDFELAQGHVMATYLRPLQLHRAIPYAAETAARAALLTRIQRLLPEGPLGLDPDAARWQLRAPVAAPAGPGYFPREQVLADSMRAGTAVRLRFLPRAGYFQAHIRTGATQTVLPLGFPLYQFAQGDVDNDGHPDLLAGPVKTTHFDSTMRRRLFVYRVAQGRATPRWLGSRVMYRLLYFKAVRAAHGLTYVRTIEQQPDGRYCIGHYSWRGFGLMLDAFPARSLTLEAAYDHFIR
ncbi:CapA family protein [Hymenobacter persicinus]|uniref:CapA family protein n=1 Tax=Hymenobacter persicinus TaxID=2025506 RepID=A0A4Q5LBS0_9BACT|nr:CapA family protein [Hymenobacter persicinus]RYU78545.1 CapA family protein [Hymenobacter persicinus]